MGRSGLRSPLRRGHIARGPASKRSNSKGSEGVKDRAPARPGRLVPVVQNMAFTPTAGSALVQVAESPHSDESETGATGRTLHIRREPVKPHGMVWHLFTPSPAVRSLMLCHAPASLHAGILCCIEGLPSALPIGRNLTSNPGARQECVQH
jgi:hypothetical protein